MTKEKYIIYLKNRNVWRFTKINNGIAFRRHFRSMEAAIHFRDNYLKKNIETTTNINLKSIEDLRKEITGNIEIAEDGRPVSKSLEFEVNVNGQKEIWNYYYDTGKENMVPDYVLENGVEWNRRLKKHERKINRRKK
tara:strand:+ start:49 stop:459 length:411 start_codon:yes stop_codon:yes gene_type:complete